MKFKHFVDSFMCPDGSAITFTSLCDFMEDCADGSDEVFCGKHIHVQNKMMCSESFNEIDSYW